MDQSSSPERPLVKVTYLNRQKRKRTGDHDLSESPLSETFNTTPEQTPLRSWRVFEKGGYSRNNNPHGSKRFCLDTDSPSVSTASAQKKTRYPRSSAVPDLDIMNYVPTSSVPDSMQVSAATANSTRLRSSRCTDTLDSEFEDGASVADSITSNRTKRRLEPDRIQYFRHQPYCGELQPHEATCTKCNKMVNLGRRQTYAIRPWENHRRRCDRNSTNSPISAQPGYLEHSERGQGSDVDSIVRKKKFENDVQVASFGARHVVCVVCKMTIFLSEDAEYELGHWEKHKLICFPPTTNQDLSKGEGATSSPVSIAPLPVGSPSVASPITETTLISVDTRRDSLTVPPPSENIGIISSSGQLGAPSLDSASNKDSKKVIGEEPDALSLVMLPFRAFIRGFRESLGRA